MIDLTQAGAPHGSPLMIRKFLYCCYFLHHVLHITRYISKIFTDHITQLSTIHQTFGNLQACVHVVTYCTHTRYTCETNHVCGCTWNISMKHETICLSHVIFPPFCCFSPKKKSSLKDDSSRRYEKKDEIVQTLDQKDEMSQT